MAAANDARLPAGEGARWILDPGTTEREIERYLAKLTDRELEVFLHDWSEWGRSSQQTPPGEWYVWLLLTGRGWGKNRTLSEWVHETAEALPGSHGALVARTAADVRDTVVRGISGILATQKPWNPVDYLPSTRVLVWKNGTTAHTYTSEEPDQLRGPNHHWAACDEWATWTAVKAADGGTAWDHVQYSTRLSYRGTQPRIVVATTPRPTRAMRELLADPAAVVTKGSMLENARNLSPLFLAKILERYEGTRLGRQEIEGHLLDIVEDALVELQWIEDNRIAPERVPDMQRIVIGVDPAVTAGEHSDSTGIVVAGRAVTDKGYVLADRTCKLSPTGWARRVIDAYHEFEADRIVAEVNNGGDLVAANLHAIDPKIPVTMVRASRGKHVRAEPVCALYEQQRIVHAGRFSELEDQLCRFTANGYEGDDSPDNADAAVWAFTDLFLGPQPDRVDHLTSLSIGGSGRYWTL